LQDHVEGKLYLLTLLPDGYVYDGGSYNPQQAQFIIT